jgi:hypothetical protein
MKAPNQTNLRGFIFRTLNPITRAIVLAQCLAVILAATAASAQTKVVVTSTNATVSTAEITAFMQASNSMFGNSPNPKRVPLLLAAIEREPAGPWVYHLQGFCFGVEHAGAFRLPPAKRSEVYVRAIEYLTAARKTVSTALQANPRSRELKDNLGTLDVGLALAYVESGTRTKEARALAESLLASNTVTNWNYGNIIYVMHSLLGRIALREGDVAAAKRHLAESGKTPGSPQLNSFGPDLVLAGELLQKGERDAVLQHLNKIAVFWANPGDNPRSAAELQKKIDAWKQTIRSGQIPNDHQWQAESLSLVDSKPTDETAVRNARRQACGNQLKWIELAKQSWVLDKQKPDDATPTVEDLASYLQGGRLPKCPDGGSYVIGKVSQNPRCSVAGHELPKGP